MKTRILFAVILAVGLSLGALAHAWLAAPPKGSADPSWTNAFNEESVQKMMLHFQKKLSESESVETKDPAELSKQVEVQLGILDLISKYREAEYAKYTPFSSLAGVLLGALLGAFLPRPLGKRSSEARPNP